MQAQLARFRDSVCGRAIFIGALVLALLIPLGMIAKRIAWRGSQC